MRGRQLVRHEYQLCDDAEDVQVRAVREQEVPEYADLRQRRRASGERHDRFSTKKKVSATTLKDTSLNRVNKKTHKEKRKALHSDSSTAGTRIDSAPPSSGTYPPASGPCGRRPASGVCTRGTPSS